MIYELHVRAFADSNADGIGDFRGLSDRLDYLQDLGVTALWLLPFYPSPLRDDGYDIADYTDVHPSYGTLDDFKRFLRAAHARDLRVITELVLNHTSDQHPWFQRARRAPPGSPEHEYYVWSDTPDRYREARIIFKDFEASNWSFDPVAGRYFWHRFYGHQPDLNFDNAEVRTAMMGILDFWLDLGVDGLRLDAVPYLFERDGTSCENLPETHSFLRTLRRHVDERYGDRVLVAEANQWPEDAVAYFGAGKGDECHAAFHFPLMPRLFMAIRTEDRFPVLDILGETPPIPETAQWLLFLRNHDELTLEMVTDEERDYMYRQYASDPRARINLGIRHRLAPLLGNDRRRIELMNALLLSLPGTPVVYYGDEIGMGDNIYLGDRDSMRTPMQWSADRNAGFSRANPQRLYLPVIQDPEYHPDAVNIENQLANRHSLLWWMRRIIALRRRHAAFGRGALRFLDADNPKVLAFERTWGDDRIVVVANLSRFAQSAELALQDARGLRPVELFGQTPFPLVTERPYVLTLGPHAFFWLRLTAPERARPLATDGHRLGARAVLPVVPEAWPDPSNRGARDALERAIGAMLPRRRWFRGKARKVAETEIVDVVPLGEGDDAARLVLLEVRFADGEPESYALPLRALRGDHAHALREHEPGAVVAEIAAAGQSSGGALLVDALHDADTLRGLLDDIGKGRIREGTRGRLVSRPTMAFQRLRGDEDEILDPVPTRVEQSNTSVRYGDRLILKVYRVIAEGQNPDVEIGRCLTALGFPHTPPTAGYVEYERRDRPPATLALLQGFVRNEGDAWRYTIDHLRRAFERLVTRGVGAPPTSAARHPLDRADVGAPDPIIESLGGYLDDVRLLGRRTGEMHLALAGPPDDAAFRPEPFTPFSRRSLFQSLRATANQVFPLLARRVPTLPDDVRPLAERVLAVEAAVVRRFEAVRDRTIEAMRMRVHGDYHLGQVLRTGKDFVIIDFEGEPARPLGERRIKRSPVRDIAGMLRSFHYATHAALGEETRAGAIPADSQARMTAWAEAWADWMGATFLRAYLDTLAESPVLPSHPDDLRALFDAYLLEKAVYEVGYELNNRPDWVRIPLLGVLGLIDEAGAGA